MQRRTLVGNRDETTQLPTQWATETDDLRSFLTISRTHPTDIQERQIVVRVNGGRPTSLYFGESITDEIRPGRHHVRVHNTLMWRNVRLAVEPGEHLELVVINSGRWWTWGLAGVFGAAPLFLRVELRSKR